MILIAAATPWEAGPLRNRLPTPSLRNIGKHSVMVVETGVGTEKTRQTLEALGGFQEGIIGINSGLAGALQPGIRSGELVADMRGAPVDFVQAAREAAQEVGIALHVGSFYCADRVLAEPAQKRAVGESQRALAVDMESAAVRSWCESRGGIFLGLRAVLDTLDQRLPLGIYEGDGSTQDLARYAAKHWREMPSLISIGFRQNRAMRRLTSFMGAFLIKLNACTNN